MERLALDLEIADVAIDALTDDRNLNVPAEARRLHAKYPHAGMTENEIATELNEAAKVAGVD